MNVDSLFKNQQKNLFIYVSKFLAKWLKSRLTNIVLFIVFTRERRKMIKRLLVTLIAFVTVFFTQSQVWAAANNAEQTTQAINVSIDKSTFLASDDAPAMMAKRMGDGGANSMLWIASIFITGLGQILMGDVWRGLRFAILAYGIIILGSILLPIIVGSLAGTGNAGLIGIAGIIGLVAWVAYLVVHVWNIIDAYNMSQEQSGMSKLNDQEMAKLEQEMKAAVEVANRIKVSNNGAVSFNAFAF